MTTKAIILTFLTLIGLTSFSAAQGAAQATMRVSVEVVNGSSVETVQPNAISLVKGNKSSLGMLRMKGSKDVLIKSISTLTLENGDGESLKMNVVSNKDQNNLGQQSISFEGISNDNMMSSIYRGSLTTTIEYL